MSDAIDAIDLSRLPVIPPATIAAARGCIRLTVLDPRNKGITMVFPLDQIAPVLEDLEALIGTEFDQGGVMSLATGSLKLRPITPDEEIFAMLCFLWAARKGDSGFCDTIDLIARSTGRVAVLIRQKSSISTKRASWTISAGVETGTNESSPSEHFTDLINRLQEEKSQC